MTIIIGYKEKDKVTIAGDTRGTKGHQIIHRVDGKTFTVHGISYGFTSSYRMGQILKYHMPEVYAKDRSEDTFKYVVNSLVPTFKQILFDSGFNGDYDSHNEVGGVFLIALDGKLFCIESDFQVVEPLEDYYAVGCGDEFALGSLYQTSKDTKTDVKAKITEALNCACYFSKGCGGTYTFEENISS
jgi:ATP-dependent protease HslVU (ClpYQ) peptidase subunit